jgi:hypothetical protein
MGDIVVTVSNPELAKKIRGVNGRHCHEIGGTLTGIVSISGETILEAQQPCVYMLWRGMECLYVGTSCRGLARPLDPKHERIGDEIRSGDDLLAFWFSDIQIALEIEYWLIRLLKPSLNREPKQWVHKTTYLTQYVWACLREEAGK